MTCTTFLHDCELNQKLPDAEAQYILDRVRELSGKDWQVVPLPSFEKKKWFSKKKPVQYYGVYVYIGGIGPWQQINFFSSENRSSINLYVTLEEVVAFFLGMYSGLNNKKE